MTGRIADGARGLPSLPKELLQRSFLDYAVHVSTKHRFIYVINPKVACSSILWTLRRLENRDADSVPGKVGVIHDRSDSPLACPSDLKASVELLEDDGYFRFTFVRNPFDRLLSCYLNKIVRPTVQRGLAHRAAGRKSESDDLMPIDEFVEVIAKQSIVEMDPHWRPQWAQTLQGVARFDAIGRFEDFDRELSRIGESISPEFARYVYREERQATGPKPYHLLTDETADRIREIYRDDFHAFDYSLEVPG